ncbi:hypothetical protein CH63R_02275 [Colletotrichum higginsianum IMI 349063]|uniref:Uncharacterized protein n=2 Tax=Colletotrichum higginsianum TaxID=80884 RepID=A0A1B7YNF8_COLHI|nr:hypothetical protein CH63R_02275 [Colletotrichum higginsianum IMI 349063]OBR13549.1 hypothetical protein CH63R_02275 [Colletotrichum higginsianum IMI 349063]TID02095.1 hypothetical protein CH35J_003763 [Colletotrichum higginsianum]
MLRQQTQQRSIWALGWVAPRLFALPALLPQLYPPCHHHRWASAQQGLKWSGVLEVVSRYTHCICRQVQAQTSTAHDARGMENAGEASFLPSFSLLLSTTPGKAMEGNAARKRRPRGQSRAEQNTSDGRGRDGLDRRVRLETTMPEAHRDVVVGPRNLFSGDMRRPCPASLSRLALGSASHR